MEIPDISSTAQLGLSNPIKIMDLMEVEVAAVIKAAVVDIARVVIIANLISAVNKTTVVPKAVTIRPRNARILTWVTASTVISAPTLTEIRTSESLQWDTPLRTTGFPSVEPQLVARLPRCLRYPSTSLSPWAVSQCLPQASL